MVNTIMIIVLVIKSTINCMKIVANLYKIIYIIYLIPY
jgi:hypothetical protein